MRNSTSDERVCLNIGDIWTNERGSYMDFFFEEIQTSEVERHCFLGHNYFSSHHLQFYAIFSINRLISINSSRLKSAEKEVCLGWLDEHSVPFSSQKKQILLLRCGEDQKVELL